MKKLSILVFAICCLSCKSSHSQKKINPETINIEAIKLTNEAGKLYFEVLQDRIKLVDEAECLQKSKKAVSLLNRAIVIDSNYYIAYHNKLVFQTLLDQQDSAFLTAKLIVKKWPENEPTKITLGEYYELKSDSVSAFECYKKALVDINNILDSPGIDSNQYQFEQIEKAKVLILINQPEKAHSILKDASYKENNETVKRYMKRLMKMSRHEFLLTDKSSLTIF